MEVESIADVKTGDVVIKRISAWAGYTGGKEFLRFWTSLGTCMPNTKDFGGYINAYEKLGREEK
jgi:hypothetical protein